jgi:hypothetical protein
LLYSVGSVLVDHMCLDIYPFLLDFSNLLKYKFLKYSLIIIWIVVVFVVIAPLSSLISSTCVLSLYLSASLTKGLSILLIFLKSQLFVSLIFFFIVLIFTLIFLISFYLVIWYLACFYFFKTLRYVIRLFIWNLSDFFSVDIHNYILPS